MDGDETVKQNDTEFLSVLPKADEAIIPVEKFLNYVLDPINSRGKSISFREALGYTKENADLLIMNIRQNLKNFPAEKKGDRGYGEMYAVLMELVGVNNRLAHVLTDTWFMAKPDRELL